MILGRYKPTVTTHDILSAFMEAERRQLSIVELQEKLGHSDAFVEVKQAADNMIEGGLLERSDDKFVGYALTNSGYEKLREMLPRY